MSTNIIKISSLDNPRIKYFASLNDKKVRLQEKKFLVEGYHLCMEATSKNLLTDLLICDEKDKVESINLNQYLVPYEIIKKVTKTVTPQPIVGIVQMKNNFSYDGDFYLLLDDISDPGNLGTIIRSAVAFGVNSLILSPNSVDIYNDKVIRSTQGALFEINHCYEDLEKAISILKSKNIKVFGTSLQNSVSLNELVIPEKWALIFGNEAHGVSKHLLSQTDQNIIIPISSKMESLNVSVSAGICLYVFSKSKFI